MAKNGVATTSPGVAKLADMGLLLVLIVHALICPYTKVEESFNTQAVHDILVHQTSLASYDHLMFPGVVPRSFLGAFVTAAVAAPTSFVLRATGATAPFGLYVFRISLAILSFICLRRLRVALQVRAGVLASVCFVFLFITQFHLPFYASRSLPNTFALQLCSLALAYYIQGPQGYPTAVRLLAFCAAAVRCEVALWLGCVCLDLLVTRRVAFKKLVDWVVTTAGSSIIVSVALDSVMWSGTEYLRVLPGLSLPLIWPEGSVFYFNGVEQRSQEWGTLPWHWYATSGLTKSVPACILAMSIGIVFGAKRRRFIQEVVAWLAPIAGLSFLGHKELRFVFPSLVALTAFGAMGMAEANRALAPQRGRLLVFRVISLGSLLACAGLVAVRSVASIYNYPAGHAMYVLGEHLSGRWTEGGFLHPILPLPWKGAGALNITEIMPLTVVIDDSAVLAQQHWLPNRAGKECSVHVDAHSAMSGISRFVHPDVKLCSVSKEEFDINNPSDAEVSKMLLDRGLDYAISRRQKIQGYRAVAAAIGYRRFDLKPLTEGRLPKLVVAPEIFVHQREDVGGDGPKTGAP